MEVDPIKTQMGSSKPLLRLLPEAISFSQNKGNHDLLPRAVSCTITCNIACQKA